MINTIICCWERFFSGRQIKGEAEMSENTHFRSIECRERIAGFRKLLTISFLAFTVLFAGCGSKTENSVEEKEPTDTSQDQESAAENPSEDAEQKTDNEITTHNIIKFNPVNDGYAWLLFSDDFGNEYTGLMDSNNTVLFYTDGNKHFDRDNYIIDDKYFRDDPPMSRLGSLVLDFEGNTVLYEDDFIDEDGNKPKILASGDGYWFLRYHVTNFDENYYRTAIVDATGKEVVDMTAYNEWFAEYFGGESGYNDLDDIERGYLGDGVFWETNKIATVFADPEDWGIKLFDTKSGKMIPSESNIYSSATKTVLKNRINDAGKYVTASRKNSDDIGIIRILDTSFPEKADGIEFIDPGIYNITLPDDFDPPLIVNMSGDYVLWYNSKNKTVGTVNITNGEIKTYNGKYADKVDCINGYHEYHGLAGFDIFNDTILVTLIGKDNLQYFVLLDKDLNELCEPIKASAYDFTGGYVLTDKGLYDTKGNLVRDDYKFKEGEYVYHIYETGLGTIIPFDGGSRCERVDGSPIDWSQINFTKAKKITLE